MSLNFSASHWGAALELVVVSSYPLHAASVVLLSAVQRCCQLLFLRTLTREIHDQCACRPVAAVPKEMSDARIRGDVTKVWRFTLVQLDCTCSESLAQPTTEAKR